MFARPTSSPDVWLLQYELFVNRVVEVAVLGDPAMQSFALRYANGSIELGTPTSLVGGFEYNAEWLQGSYAAMANGHSHLCFLLTSGLVECRAADAPVAGFNLSSGVLMEHRSEVRFSQIAAANCFTCALRLNDSMVECFGSVVEGWLVQPPPAVPMTLHSSLLQYRVIAAQYAGGWCGLTLDAAGRDLYCWSVNNTIESLALPAPTAPLFWRAPFFSSEQTRGCALRNDGRFACNWTDGTIYHPDPSVQTPVSDLTSWRLILNGAEASTGNILRYFDAVYDVLPNDFAFTPPRLIGVDAAQGDDARCAAANTLSAAELMAFVPCATLAGAMQQLTRRNTWIQFLPGTHMGGGALINFVDVTLSSQPPPFLTATDLAMIGNGSWAQRMTEAAAVSSAAVLDCSGFINCVFCEYRRLSLLGMSFTGSTEHAIRHNYLFADDPTEPDLTMRDCSFFRAGGMLYKSQGNLIINGCSMSEATQNFNVKSLVYLFEVSGSIHNSNWTHNYFLDNDPADTSLCSCISMWATKGGVLDFRGLTFVDNHASAPFTSAVPPPAVLGGVAVQIRASSLQTSFLQCTFINQTTSATSVYGGEWASHRARDRTAEQYLTSMR